MIAGLVPPAALISTGEIHFFSRSSCPTFHRLTDAVIADGTTMMAAARAGTPLLPEEEEAPRGVPDSDPGEERFWRTSMFDLAV